MSVCGITFHFAFHLGFLFIHNYSLFFSPPRPPNPTSFIPGGSFSMFPAAERWSSLLRLFVLPCACFDHVDGESSVTFRLRWETHNANCPQLTLSLSVPDKTLLTTRVFNKHVTTALPVIRVSVAAGEKAQRAKQTSRGEQNNQPHLFTAAKKATRNHRAHISEGRVSVCLV